MARMFPPGYEPPKGDSDFYKLVAGIHRIRIITKPEIGLGGWQKTAEGPRPTRVRRGEQFTAKNAPNDGKAPREFWAFGIWSYKDQRVMVLEVNQKTIMDAIFELDCNDAWGDLRAYDIEIRREGSGMNDTKYSVTPLPKGRPPAEVIEGWKAAVDGGFDLGRIFTDNNPFNRQLTPTTGPTHGSADEDYFGAQEEPAQLNDGEEIPF